MKLKLATANLIVVLVTQIVSKMVKMVFLFFSTSMELNLDDLRRRLIRKIDVEVKETLESFSGGDDFLLHPGGRIQGKGGSVNDLRSQQGSNENVASTGSGGATSEQHHCDETDKSAAERTALVHERILDFHCVVKMLMINKIYAKNHYLT